MGHFEADPERKVDIKAVFQPDTHRNEMKMQANFEPDRLPVTRDTIQQMIYNLKE